MKKTYLQPEVDITWLSMECLICSSGEDLTVDDPANPFAAPLFTDFSSLL